MASGDANAFADLSRSPAEGDVPPRRCRRTRSTCLHLAALTCMLAIDGQWRAPYWQTAALGARAGGVERGGLYWHDFFPPVMAAMVTPGCAAWATGANASVTMAGGWRPDRRR